MNIYLDIDGTILNRELGSAKFCFEFIKNLLDKYPVYWLSTHCKDDSQFTIQFLEKYFNEETIEIMKNILPTNWNTLKTEAIDFSKPFLWFDDYLFEAEKQILIKNNCLNSWIKIDLNKNPEQLKEYLDI